jgi:anti-sigma regulatory factor (Ser/Thr protein kinase)
MSSSQSNRDETPGEETGLTERGSIPEQADRPGEFVELTFPAHPRYVSTARLVASSLASDLDFSVDEIDELRIAIDEALTVLVGGHELGGSPGRSVRVRFESSAIGTGAVGRLRMRGWAEPSSTTTPGHADALVRRILQAVTDSFELEEDRFTLVKSTARPSRPPLRSL